MSTILCHCSSCGGQIPPDAPEGFCPRCELVGALATDSGSAGGRGLPCSFGDYELEAEIARGGMGVVYKARQTRLKRSVAVKTILAGQLASWKDVQRFQAEAEAAAHLRHPNIVPIYEVGEEEGQQFFSMEYVDGQSLAEIVREKPLPAHRAATYVKQIAEAIHYAHGQGVLHRDLKPSNILIDSFDQPRITDFGLAKKMTLEGDLTMTGQVLGSPSFMPPEQASGQLGRIGPQSDVYSLGAVLFCLLTGRPPFIAETLADTLEQVRYHPPVSPRILLPSVPKDLEIICLKCLEKEPNRRYQSAAELAADLGRFLRGEPIQARRANLFEKGGRWARRHPAIASLSGGLVVSIVIGFVAVTVAWRQARHSAITESKQRQRFDELSALLELQTSEELFGSDNASAALAHLARLVRRQPSNRVAVERLVSALTYRTFALPAATALTASGPVRFAQFSPDDATIFTVSTDGALASWNAATGEPFGLRSTFAARPSSFAVSEDGHSLLTGDANGKAIVWDSGTGAQLAELSHDGVVRANFNPDAQRVATGCNDGSVRIWDWKRGVALLTIKGHQASVEQPHFSPDGRFLVTASEDRTAAVWDVQTGILVGQRLKHSKEVRAAVFSPDGGFVATCAADKTARIWNALTGEPCTPPMEHGEDMYSICFSPDGARVLTAVGNNTAQLWDNKGNLLGRVAHSLPVSVAEWNRDGSQLATASVDGTARVWNSETLKPVIESIVHGRGLNEAKLNRRGDRLLTCSGVDPSALLWDVSMAYAQPRELRHEKGLRSALFSRDGQYILTASEDGIAQVWSVATGQPALAPLVHGTTLIYAEFSPEGDHVLTASEDGSALVWNIKEVQPSTVKLRHGQALVSARFSPDGKLVLTASRDGTAQIWNSATGAKTFPPMRHRQSLCHAEFSFDGQRVVTCSVDTTARIWDAGTGSALSGELKHEHRVNYARFSMDGGLLVTASADHTARLWDGRNGEPRGLVLPHNSHVVDAQFSPRGDRLVTACIDGTARIWDVQTGHPLSSPLPHGGRVNSARFSPDGDRVVTASGDQTVRLWDGHTGYPLSEPLRHRNWVLMAQFSPDGERIVSASAQRAALLWEAPRGRIPAPSWLPDLAEAVGRQRLNDRNILEISAWTNFFSVKASISQFTNDAFYSSWGKWFLADGRRQPLKSE